MRLLVLKLLSRMEKSKENTGISLTLLVLSDFRLSFQSDFTCSGLSQKSYSNETAQWSMPFELVYKRPPPMSHLRVLVACVTSITKNMVVTSSSKEVIDQFSLDILSIRKDGESTTLIQERFQFQEILFSTSLNFHLRNLTTLLLRSLHPL